LPFDIKTGLHLKETRNAQVIAGTVNWHTSWTVKAAKKWQNTFYAKERDVRK
jgi:hypothetical protein